MPDESLNGPLLLLGAIWLSAVPVMTANKQLHEQRDVVMGITDLTHLTPKRAYAVKSASLSNSYVPLLGGVLLFLIIMTAVLYFTAQFIKLPTEELRWMCSAVTIMPVFMFFGFLIGGLQDIFAMRRILKEDKKLLEADTKASSGADQHGYSL